MRNTTQWKLGGTVSFRLASSKIFDTYGSNLQNPSDNVKTIYIPSPSKRFVQVDLAGADAFITAYLTTQGGNFRQMFEAGIKSHTFIAMHLFREHWRNSGHQVVDDFVKLSPRVLSIHPDWPALAKFIKDDYLRYYIGKKAGLSFTYRMQPNTFIIDVLKESYGKVALSKQEGEKFYQGFHTIFPEFISGWYPELDGNLRESRTLRNLFGYPRLFEGPFTDAYFREATAWIPQSTVAIVTEKASVDLQMMIEGSEGLGEWDFLNQTHDSILGQCPSDDVEHMAWVMKNLMEQTLTNFRGEQFKMKTEVSVGMNWGRYDAKTNPEGMREITVK